MNLELGSDILDFRSQDEIYDFCDRVWTEISYCGSRFNRWSSPYIFSTEFPWLNWPDDLPGKYSRVLTIAGSGDVPLFFKYLGVTDLIAVDVSYHACMWNELKRCMVKGFDFMQIKRIFSDVISSPRTEKKKLWADCFYEIVECMSSNAGKYWVSIANSGIDIVKKFLRPSDSLFSDKAFYLRDELTYERLKVADLSYSLYNLPLEVMLYKLPDGCLDLIYCSNFIEYLRMDRKKDFPGAFRDILVNAMRVLVPNGIICFYETARKDRVLSYYSELPVKVKDFMIKEITFRPRSGFVFRHCMVFLTLCGN